MDTGGWCNCKDILFWGRCICASRCSRGTSRPCTPAVVRHGVVLVFVVLFAADSTRPTLLLLLVLRVCRLAGVLARISLSISSRMLGDTFELLPYKMHCTQNSQSGNSNANANPCFGPGSQSTSYICWVVGAPS